MRKKPYAVVIFLTILCILYFTSCAPSSQETSTLPDEILTLKERIIEKTTSCAAILDGAWGDQHNAMMLSGEARNFPGYEDMKRTLSEIGKESGAGFVYTLYPDHPDDPKNFLITVDGSDVPDDWLASYPAEPWMIEASLGTPAAADYAWDNEAGEPFWSVFVPVHDSEGNVIAIAGMDLPVPELSDYPEWNRDRPEWSGNVE